MNNIRTVSDTKRNFYTFHTRPINSIYRRVVEELICEMHLLSVSAGFKYDPIYALGVVTVFDRFMQGYAPESDKSSIFNALVKSQNDDPDKYRSDAKRLEYVAASLSSLEMLSLLTLTWTGSEADDLKQVLQGISQNEQFKYSRLFAIGLFTLLELTDANFVQDEQQREQALKKICIALNLSVDKVTKDLELYRSNLDKLVQVKLALEDALKSGKKSA